MATSKLELLKNIENDLLNELKKVQELIVMNNGEPANLTQERVYTHSPTFTKPLVVDNTKSENNKTEAIKLGKRTWGEYVSLIGEMLGDAKSSQIYTYAHWANPKIPEKRLSDAIKTTLYKLSKDEGLPSTPAGNTRKDGYIYHFKEWKQKGDRKPSEEIENQN